MGKQITNKIYLRQPDELTLIIGANPSNCETITKLTTEEIAFIKHYFGAGYSLTSETSNIERARQLQIIKRIDEIISQTQPETNPLRNATIAIEKLSGLGAKAAFELAKNDTKLILTHSNSVIGTDEVAAGVFAAKDVGTERINAMNRLLLKNGFKTTVADAAKQCDFFINIFNLNADSKLCQNLQEQRIAHISILTQGDSTIISPIFSPGLNYCNNCFCKQFNPGDFGKAWSNETSPPPLLSDTIASFVTAKVWNFLANKVDEDSDYAVIFSNLGSTIRYCKTQAALNCDCDTFQN